MENQNNDKGRSIYHNILADVFVKYYGIKDENVDSYIKNFEEKFPQKDMKDIVSAADETYQIGGNNRYPKTISGAYYVQTTMDSIIDSLLSRYGTENNFLNSKLNQAIYGDDSKETFAEISQIIKNSGSFDSVKTVLEAMKKIQEDRNNGNLWQLGYVETEGSTGWYGFEKRENYIPFELAGFNSNTFISLRSIVEPIMAKLGVEVDGQELKKYYDEMVKEYFLSRDIKSKDDMERILTEEVNINDTAFPEIIEMIESNNKPIKDIRKRVVELVANSATMKDLDRLTPEEQRTCEEIIDAETKKMQEEKAKKDKKADIIKKSAELHNLRKLFTIDELNQITGHQTDETGER